MKLQKDGNIKLSQKEYRKLGFSHKELLTIAADNREKVTERAWLFVKLAFISIFLIAFSIKSYDLHSLIVFLYLSAFFGLYGIVFQLGNLNKYNKYRNEILTDKFGKVKKRC